MNIASNYLIAGVEATRWGTSHPSIVPYQVFPTKDSHIMVSAGNDPQFAILCSKVLGRPQWSEEPRFNTNTRRVENRELLVKMMEDVLQLETTAEWCQRLEGKG